MCNLFDLSVTDVELDGFFRELRAKPTTPTFWDVRPRGPAWPTDPAVIVRDLAREPNGNDAPQREALIVRWGFARRAAGRTDPLINARADTIAIKPTFAAAYRHRRCVIVASRFAEWSGPRGHKTRHWFSRTDGGLLALGGLWEAHAAEPDSAVVCTIVTARANAAVAEVHSRMPVVLPIESCDRWLEPGEPDDLDLATVIADDAMEAIALAREDEPPEARRHEPKRAQRTKPKPPPDDARPASPRQQSLFD